MEKGKKQTEEKPNRKAKQNLYDVIVKPNLEKVKDWYRNGATEEEVAKKLGISLRSLHNYKTRYPEFLEAVSKSRDIADAEVEAALFKKATGSIITEEAVIKLKKEYYENGRKTLVEEFIEKVELKREIPSDTVAAIFWLKNRRSEQWKDKRDVELSGGLKVANADVSKLSDEELRRFIDDGSGDKE